MYSLYHNIHFVQHLFDLYFTLIFKNKQKTYCATLVFWYNDFIRAKQVALVKSLNLESIMSARQFLKHGHALKEIHVDVDGRTWWLDGMASTYPLSHDNCLHFERNREEAVLSLIGKEFSDADKKNVIFQ